MTVFVVLSFYMHSKIDRFPFKSGLHIRYRPLDPYWTQSLPQRSKSPPYLSFIFVKEHIDTTQTYIGQHVTCPSSTLLARLTRRLAETMWQGHPGTVWL